MLISLFGIILRIYSQNHTLTLASERGCWNPPTQLYFSGESDTTGSNLDQLLTDTSPTGNCLNNYNIFFLFLLYFWDHSLIFYISKIFLNILLNEFFVYGSYIKDFFQMWPISIRTH